MLSPFDPDAPAPRAARATSPLSSKLNAPLPTAFEVTRTEVCESIFNAGSARLVLLRAPAGERADGL